MLKKRHLIFFAGKKRQTTTTNKQKSMSSIRTKITNTLFICFRNAKLRLTAFDLRLKKALIFVLIIRAMYEKA